jgi:glucosamine kinase
MILIADSGSTKTEWACINQGDVQLFHSAGMNPYFTSDDEVRKILNDVKKWIGQGQVNDVVFYGSGCNSTEKGSDMQKLFIEVFTDSNVLVQSDLVGAAVSLFGNKHGIAVILGTGANSGFFDGKEIGFKTESLGYVLGDEGSGASLGKEFIKSLLYHDFPSDIENEFIKEFGIGKAEILEAIYKKPFPNRFLASFTVFMKKYENHPAMRLVVENSFEALVFHHLQNYPQKYTNEFGFVGSIAWYFKDILLDVCNKHEFKVKTIIQRPMDNLVKYYSLV